MIWEQNREWPWHSARRPCKEKHALENYRQHSCVAWQEIFFGPDLAGIEVSMCFCVCRSDT